MNSGWARSAVPHGEDERLNNSALRNGALTDPMVWGYGRCSQRAGRRARPRRARTVAVVNDMGEDGVFVSAFDHGGAGATREHLGHRHPRLRRHESEEYPDSNRPAYSSEVHATRDMGVAS